MSDNPFVKPGANLQGDYRGSCVQCLRGTDSVLAFRGEAEWVLAGLQRLGMPQDEAYATALGHWREAYGTQDGQVPAGRLEQAFKVCAECAGAAGFPRPVVALPDAEVPTIEQREEGER